MEPHRIRQQTAEWSLGHIPSVKGSASGFVVCPLALQRPAGAASLWQQHLYRMALERAQAAARPSLLERAMNVVWN